MKTVLEKNEQTVTIEECCELIHGKLKRFVIQETQQYFISQKRAIRAANDLLLKKTLPKFKYNERKQEKKRRIGARRITHIYECYIDTQRYVNRWDGVIYLETKKKLLTELKHKLEVQYALYNFVGINEVNAFLKGGKK